MNLYVCFNISIPTAKLYQFMLECHLNILYNMDTAKFMNSTIIGH